MTTPSIVTLSGPRQSGKTMVLAMMSAQYTKQKGSVLVIQPTQEYAREYQRTHYLSNAQVSWGGNPDQPDLSRFRMVVIDNTEQFNADDFDRICRKWESLDIEGPATMYIVKTE